MGESQFNKPMKFNEWWAIRSQALQELRLTPEEWYKIFAGQNIDTGGTPQLMLNTSGQVTEANSSLIYGAQAVIQSHGAFPTVSQQVMSYPGSIYEKPRYKVVALAAADGGGAVAATELVGTLAGYYPVMDNLLLYSTVADTFTATIGTGGGGTLVGPATHSITTVASTMNRQLEDCLWYNLTDGTTLNIAISAATVGMVIVCTLSYHWET